MADKVRPSYDSATGVYLNRSGGAAAADHNLLASLRMLDGQLWRTASPCGVFIGNPARCQFNQTSKRITKPTAGKPILGIINGMFFDMGSECEEDGIADANGTTTYCYDSGLAAASDNFWQYAWIVWNTGANAGSVRQIDSYDATLNKLSWTEALGTAVSAGDTFTLTFFYVEDLTNGATNYIYAKVGATTAHYGVVQFYANVSGTKDSEYDLLIATAVLSGDGTCTSVNNSPSSADRLLLPVVGRYESVQSLTDHLSMGPGESTDFYATHDQMSAVAGLEVALSDADFSYSILEHYEDDRVKVRLTNDGSYTKDCTVTLYRKGTKYVTLDG